MARSDAERLAPKNSRTGANASPFPALQISKQYAIPLLGLFLTLLLFCLAIVQIDARTSLAADNWLPHPAELILSISIGINLFGVAAFVHVIRGRGGIGYLKTWFKHDATATIDAAVINRQTLFELLPPGPGRPVVFMGDSITASCEWNELFDNHTIILNRGIGGDTSVGALRRAPSIASLHPLAVFLMIGTNDAQLLRCTPEQTVSNWRSIINVIHQQSPDTVVYMQSILPSSAPKFNQWSERVNQQLSALADGSSVFFVNLRPTFVLNGVMNPEYAADGLHLNGNGYLAWKKQIAPIMQELAHRQSTLQVGQ